MPIGFRTFYERQPRKATKCTNYFGKVHLTANCTVLIIMKLLSMMTVKIEQCTRMPAAV